MIDAFKRRVDLHKMTAAAILRKPLGKVTTSDRQTAKAIAFGFLYGQSAKGFTAYARTTYGLILELEAAERFRANFFATYPALRRWHSECRRRAGNPENNCARTIF
jgi:DNA polymerase-1